MKSLSTKGSAPSPSRKKSEYILSKPWNNSIPNIKKTAYLAEIRPSKATRNSISHPMVSR